MHKAQKISNYLGIPEVSGAELLEIFMKHAHLMNVEICNIKAQAINEDGGIYNILLGDELVRTKAMIIATGLPYRSTLDREEFFLGKGLGYCATCDGPIYRDKDVLIIGHSEEAEEEANFMAEICNRVYYLPLYKETGDLNPRIEIVRSKPAAIMGVDFVEGMELKDGAKILVEGLFVLGAETAPERLVPGLEIIENHIKVDRNQASNLPGVFAAGDCTGPPYQIAKSVGEGQVAGLNASKYSSSVKNQ